MCVLGEEGRIAEIQVSKDGESGHICFADGKIGLDFCNQQDGEEDIRDAEEAGRIDQEDGIRLRGVLRISTISFRRGPSMLVEFIPVSKKGPKGFEEYEPIGSTSYEN